MTSPLNPWSTLGRQQKLALSRRDPHAIRIHLEPLPAAVRNDVLGRCDRYAQADRSREVSSQEAKRGRRV